jgi:hypothetical protein
LQALPANTLQLDTPYTIATFTPGDLFGEFGTLRDGSSGPAGNGSSDNLGNGTELQVIYNNAAGNIQLELVTTPASSTYVRDTGSGSWDTAADWNPPNNGTTPTSTSDVTIGATTDGEVTLSHDATINSLTITAQNTLNSEASLTTGGNVSVAANATLDLVNGNFGGTVADAGDITISGGGVLDSLGTVSVTGSLILSRGTIFDTTLAGAGTMR